MADIVEIESRRISGTGLIRIPEDMRDLRQYYLYADIIRQPFQRSINRDFEPPRSYYGRINFMFQGYVIAEYTLNYEAQMWELNPDPAGQALVATKCAYSGTLETFENLGVAAGYPPIITEDLTVEMLVMRLNVDEINVKMFADSAFQFVLKAFPYVYCEGGDPPSQPPPPPPEKPEPVAPQTPTDISPPYDEDDETTDPAPIDDDFDPPDVEGQWTLTWTQGAGPNVSGDFPGVDSDTWAIVPGSATCVLIGASQLVKNGTEVVVDPFNCNTTGFISTLLSAVFTPD